MFSLLEIFGYTDRNVHVSFFDNPCGLRIPVVTSNALKISYHDGASSPMCAPSALMGMGWLGTRHYETLVTATLANEQWQVRRPHNIRRAATFTRFREYVLKLLAVGEEMDITASPASNAPVVTILLPKGTGTIRARQMEQELAIHGKKVKSMLDLPSSFDAQVRLALGTSIYVVYEQRVPESVIFLPTDSVLIVIGTTIDWDIWNNMGHIRVHWLKSDLSLLTLILQEVGRLADAPLRNDKYTRRPMVAKIFEPARRVEGPPPPGQVHCIGENFDSDEPRKTWFRSCLYKNMCVNLNTSEFTLYGDHHFAPPLNDALHLSSWPNEVTMAQPRQLFKGASRWKPTLANNSHTNHYHQLQDDIVLIFYKDWDLCNMGKKFPGLPCQLAKFTSFSRSLPTGHVLWDMWLPIYTALELFNLENRVIFLTPEYRQRLCIPFWMAPEEHMVGVFDLARPRNVGNKSIVCIRTFLSGMAWLQVSLW